MNNESLYQGPIDVFLTGFRAKFDAITDQARTSLEHIKNYHLVDTDPMAMGIFTNISAETSEGERAVWRHVGTTGAQQMLSRKAGGTYQDATFLRTYETAVYDPDNQLAEQFKVPEEREMKEQRDYKAVLNRAFKIVAKIDRFNIIDPFEVFNLGFTAVASYPSGIATGRFFARGNRGLDSNNTALGERLFSTTHARADAGATQSNVVQSGSSCLSLSYANYWTAKEQGASFKDDVGDPDPRFGGRTCLMVPPKNSLGLTAQTIQQSEWIPGSNNNDENIVKGEFAEIICTPYLSDSYYIPNASGTTGLQQYQWYLIDEENRDPEIGTGLVRVEFVPLQQRTERDIYTDSIMYKIKEEYVYGFAEWRGTIASLGNNISYSS
jgi:hypothetical protein